MHSQLPVWLPQPLMEDRPFQDVRGVAVMGVHAKGEAVRGGAVRGEAVMGVVRGVCVSDVPVMGVAVAVRGEGVLDQTWLVAAKHSMPLLATWGVRGEGGRVEGAPWAGVRTGYTGHEGSGDAWPSSGGTCKNGEVGTN